MCVTGRRRRLRLKRTIGSISPWYNEGSGGEARKAGDQSSRVKFETAVAGSQIRTKIGNGKERLEEGQNEDKDSRRIWNGGNETHACHRLITTFRCEGTGTPPEAYRSQRIFTHGQ